MGKNIGCADFTFPGTPVDIERKVEGNKIDLSWVFNYDKGGHARTGEVSVHFLLVFLFLHFCTYQLCSFFFFATVEGG